MIGIDFGENRDKVIAEYKHKLLNETDIKLHPEEMAVLDNMLFRIWQMGWIPQVHLPTKDEISQAKNHLFPDPEKGGKEWHLWAVTGFERGIAWLLRFLRNGK